MTARNKIEWSVSPRDDLAPINPYALWRFHEASGSTVEVVSNVLSSPATVTGTTTNLWVNRGAITVAGDNTIVDASSGARSLLRPDTLDTSSVMIHAFSVYTAADPATNGWVWSHSHSAGPEGGYGYKFTNAGAIALTWKPPSQSQSDVWTSDITSLNGTWVHFLFYFLDNGANIIFGAYRNAVSLNAGIALTGRPTLKTSHGLTWFAQSFIGTQILPSGTRIKSAYMGRHDISVVADIGSIAASFVQQPGRIPLHLVNK